MRFFALKNVIAAICVLACSPADARPPQRQKTAPQQSAQSRLTPKAAPGAQPAPSAANVTGQHPVHDVYLLKDGVVRVQCPAGNHYSNGSGFIHNGVVVTAAHVVAVCTGDTKIYVRGTVVAIVDTVIDRSLDLAVLHPAKGVVLGAGLQLMADSDEVHIGDAVAWLGFPGGYDGLDPMLGVGTLAGIGPFSPAPGMPATKRAFVNGAFNHGNSGGPVIDPQTNRVIGVVDAKMFPMTSDVASALAALKVQKGGFQYTETTNGTQKNVSEAQVVARVLQHVEDQIQLVVGVMVLPGDIHSFLKKNNAD